MADDLPTEYEDIILGTGLQESILAAALARIGRRVLHFDRNNYYSGEWASFHLRGILEWIDSHKEPQDSSLGEQTDTDYHEDLEEGLRLLAVPSGSSLVFNLKVASYVREQPIENTVSAEDKNTGTGETYQPEGGTTDPGASPERLPTAAGATQPDGGSSASPECQLIATGGSELGEAPSDEPSHPTESSAPSSESVEGDGSNESPGLEEGAPESGTLRGLVDQLESSEPRDPQSPSGPSTCSGTNDPTGSEELPGLKDPSEAEDPSEHVDSSGPNDSSGPDDTSRPDDLSTPDDPPEPQDQTVSDAPEGSQGEETNNLNDDPGAIDAPPEEEVEGQHEGQRSHDAAEALTRREWTWKEIDDNWRRFNIDLAPKLMFCRGSMVSLLVQSRISRYAEFKAVSRLLTLIGDKLEHVPCSRSDVFSSRYVSMLEKRMLMKLIEFVLHYQDRTDDYEGYQDKPFSAFLQKRKLTPTLQHFVIHSIAMVTANTPTEKALEAMQFFLKSLGRYGNTAFLWTLYGSGELPQCFCRMSAVFGGIYMLRTSAKYLIVDNDNACKGVIDSEGRRLTSSNVIMDHSYAAQSGRGAESTRFVSRAVLFTDKTLKESQGDEITFLTIPPLKDGEEPIRLLEVGSSACAAPKGIFVVHLTRECTHFNAESDLRPVVDMLFQDLQAEIDYSSERPKVLWSMFFSYKDKTALTVEELRSGQPRGVYVTGGPGASVGYQHAVKQAQEIFELICPGEEFLPPAPNPEDIIYEDPTGDNPGHSKKAGFEDVPEEKESTAAASADVSDTLADPEENMSDDVNRSEEEQGVGSMEEGCPEPIQEKEESTAASCDVISSTLVTSERDKSDDGGKTTEE